MAQGAFYPQDSSWQKVLECQNFRKKAVKIFKKGDYVLIRERGRFRKTRGKIQGFLNNQIVIKGKKIHIDDIQTIRKWSFLLKITRVLTVSLVVLFIIVIVTILLFIASLISSTSLLVGLLGFLFVIVYFDAIALLFLVFIAIISILLLVNYFIQMNRTVNLNTWQVRIISRLGRRIKRRTRR